MCGSVSLIRSLKQTELFQRLEQRVPAWLVYSMLALVLWGIWGAISKVVSDQVDPYTNQALFAIGMIPLLPLVCFSRQLKVCRQRKRGILYAFGTGILGGTGNIAFFKSLTVGGKASVVVPLTSLSPIATVVLGYFVLRERLTNVQKVGLVLALVAIYLLSI